jgi:hypothetical protein
VTSYIRFRPFPRGAVYSWLVGPQQLF